MKMIKKQFEDICFNVFKISHETITEQLKLIEKLEFSADDEIVKSSPFVERWYNSLATKPDFSLYDENYYLFAGFLSYKHWSRHYIKTLEKINIFNINDIKSVIDFGNGLGFSTIDLAKLFSKAKIIGTNIINSKQFEFAENLTKDFKTIINIDEKKIHKFDCDIAFCSEYFEHFSEPIEHLEHIITKYNPKYLVIANAFGVLAVGHFISYNVYNQQKDPEKTRKIFSQTLKNMGYTKIKHSGWNNRPNIFIKN